ncbi:FAD-binding oxidoreductase [Pseudaquabacterium pictum]|uniref:D-2-hydroxyacid dehydrogenase n=1 Tax=Pseudaquabacterium pictum TaxID=2315236 RepID=A0A480APF0_9BURK|nr:FAD-binding oxidoreductase [Rubrivivax pictus]GCL62876.1 D-2-hydroxyacid dehydrogenase [Rubrivivax pictus]
MDLADLRAAFAGRLLADTDAMAPHLTDWRRKWTGRAIAVAQPDTAAGVAAVVRWCKAQGVAVVPQGGNTGLSGGATPAADGRSLVLSTARLQRIRALDPIGQTITAEAGVTLQQLQDTAREAGRLFPLSLAAQGTCTIGGNLATNAGGVQVLRYGNARDLCLGLEVVTAEGELWDGLRPLRKDNTGYALRDLFIGSEGTLGVVTAAVLKLFPLPAAQVAAFVAVPSPAAALALLAGAQARLASELSAFEMLSETCLQLVLQHVDAARRPLAWPSPWYVLLEVSSAQGEQAATEAIEAVLEAALEAGHASDAALSASLAQFRSLWALREDISEAQGAAGPTIKHDIALPIGRIPEFIERTDAALAQHHPALRLVVFGHLGDGNLHYNLSPPAAGMAREAFTALEAPVNRLVHDMVHALGGSISAEHGLGVLRRDESARYKPAVELRLMQAVKQALDPLNLMNPGKLLGTPIPPNNAPET